MPPGAEAGVTAANRLSVESHLLTGSACIPGLDCYRFVLNPDTGKKSVILNLTSLPVVTIAEIVPDLSDLRIARGIRQWGGCNQLGIRSLGDELQGGIERAKC